jgi:hypothetical protein
LLACVHSSAPAAELADAAPIDARKIAIHVGQLASDEFAGRGPGTRGETQTIRYLEAQFAQSGLKPGNPDGTYLQKVPLVGFQSLPKIVFAVGDEQLALAFPDDFFHDRVALRARASVKNADVVFAGYGIAAPAYGWDDYRGIDVRNKLVIVLNGEPSRASPDDSASTDPAFFKGDTRTFYSTRDFKFDLAAAKGAAAILIVSDAKAAHQEGYDLPSRKSSSTILSGRITTDAVRRVLSLAGKDLDQLKAAASRPDSRAVLINARAGITVQSRIRQFTSHNVVARIEGSDARLKDEYILYSAHWDHLGTDSGLAGDQIYNGAIDNAVGTSQLLEIARAFSALANKPKRSFLFVATTAEEKGYLGSRFYAQHPLVPLARTVANINLDGGNAWGVTSDLIVTGYGLSTLDEVLGEAAALQGRTFINEPIDDGSLYFASDQVEFAKAGIPAAFPFSGSDYVGKPQGFGDSKWEAYSKVDYHQVSDDIKPDWDLSGAAKDAAWLMIAGQLLAASDLRPEWKPGSEFAR